MLGTSYTRASTDAGVVSRAGCALLVANSETLKTAGGLEATIPFIFEPSVGALLRWKRGARSP